MQFLVATWLNWKDTTSANRQSNGRIWLTWLAVHLKSKSDDAVAKEGFDSADIKILTAASNV
jgi:hypothetical protein